MRDIGILVRSNREAAEILDCILQKANQDLLTEAAGKSFQVISGEALKIMNNPAIALILSTFRLLTVRESESGIFKAECARLYAQIQSPDNILIEMEQRSLDENGFRSDLINGRHITYRIMLRF
jgi:ATP-dependent helicase/nuclease subunit A